MESTNSSPAILARQCDMALLYPSGRSSSFTQPDCMHTSSHPSALLAYRPPTQDVSTREKYREREILLPVPDARRHTLKASKSCVGKSLMKPTVSERMAWRPEGSHSRRRVVSRVAKRRSSPLAPPSCLVRAACQVSTHPSTLSYRTFQGGPQKIVVLCLDEEGCFSQ